MRQISYILVLVFLFPIFNGCQNSERDSISSQFDAKVEKRLIRPVITDSIDINNMTKLDEFSYDLDMDDSDEKIALYTTAERNEKKEMMWDDGQNWFLVVWDGGKAYPLLSEYVQLGSVYFSISNNSVDKISNINVIIQTAAGFSLKTFAFDNDKSGYIGVTVYNSKDNNFVYTSIPGY